MPALETKDLYQDALLWPFVDIDQFGQHRVSSTVQEVKVRWVNKQSIQLDPQRNPLAVDATAVVDLDVEIGSIMWEGGLSDLPADTDSPTSGLFEVKTFNSTPDLKNRGDRRTVGLIRRPGALPAAS